LQEQGSVQRCEVAAGCTDPQHEDGPLSIRPPFGELLYKRSTVGDRLIETVKRVGESRDRPE
jgi:hypothetical protein